MFHYIGPLLLAGAVVILVFFRPKFDPIKETGASQSSHVPGNAVPIKTINHFGKVGDYLHAKFNPFNSSHSESFYDLNNLPRTDYMLPGGKKIVTYGFKNLCRTSEPGHPHGWAIPGQVLSEKKYVQRATVADKNLNEHRSIWHDAV